MPFSRLRTAAASLLRTLYPQAESRVRTLERRLESTRRDAASAAESRRRLLASLDHDLRGPLSAIIGFQELLVDGVYGTVDEQGQDALARIGTAAHNLLTLIDVVVDVARLESGDATLRLEDVQPDALFTDAAERAARFSSDHRGSLQCRIETDLQTVHTDPDRLRSLVEMAAAAALLATPNADLELRVRGHGDRLDFTLHGTRLPAPTGPRPATVETSRRPGLHLDLAARLAPILGGRLTLHSAADSTTLRLELPTGARRTH